MSFGNSNIYPFPAVQYIPMSVTTICRGPINGNTSKTASSMLIAGPEIMNWQKILAQEYGISLPYSLPDGGFPILALNLAIDEARYRGFTLTMTGLAESNYYQYFTVPQRYFYKTKLFFEVYNKRTNTLLARYSFFMPKTNLSN